MIILTEGEVQKAVTMSEVVTAVENAYRDYADGRIFVPPRVTLAVRGEEQSCIFLPACHMARPFYGLKQASSFPANRARGLPTVMSEIHLYSAETGEPLAVLAANHLTALKTGAASAVATRYLAGPGPVTLALIGSGIQARTQLSGTLAVRPVKEVRLYDLFRSKAEELAREIRESGSNIPVIVHDDPNACVRGAQVICTITTSTRPVFDGRFLDPGAHLNAVGSFTPVMQEIDAEAVVRADKVVTDVISAAWEAAGDLLVPLALGMIDKTKIYGELGSVVSGRLPGRQRETEITLYESLGFAALDLAVAVAVYEKALRMGIGREIPWS